MRNNFYTDIYQKFITLINICHYTNLQPFERHIVSIILCGVDVHKYGPKLDVIENLGEIFKRIEI